MFVHGFEMWRKTSCAMAKKKMFPFLPKMLTWHFIWKKNVYFTLQLKVAETLKQVLLVVSMHWLHCMRPSTSEQQHPICQDRCCALLLFLPGELPWRQWPTMRRSGDDISLCLLQHAWKWPVFLNLLCYTHDVTYRFRYIFDSCNYCETLIATNWTLLIRNKN